MHHDNLQRMLEANRLFYARKFPHIYGKWDNRYASHKAAALDFVGQLSRGRTLLVGEGNLSFALSLAKMPHIGPRRLTATTFEAKSDLSPSAQANASTLCSLGVTVLYGVDARDLSTTLGSQRFDNIVFQFPNAGRRDGIRGLNPNFILIRKFLRSAVQQLAPNGQVYISAVDSPYYEGTFHFDEAAAQAGFWPPEMYNFDPAAFPGYEHTMTHQSGSALDNHDQFGTWVFKPE